MNWKTLLIGLIILILSAGLASASDRLDVGDFKDIYYMNDEDSVKIKTTITIVGDVINGNDVPVYIKFYNENTGDMIASYELEDELIDYQIDYVGGKPIYKYKNYTDDFWFNVDIPGPRSESIDIDFRLVITFDHFQDYNEVHSVKIDMGRDPTSPDPDTTEKVISGAIILLIVVVVALVLSGVGVAVKYYPRKDLTSKTHIGMDIEAGDTELMVDSGSDKFKKVPRIKKLPTLESKTSQSEIDID